MESSYVENGLTESSVAEALNVPVYNSEWYIPQYREFNTGKWRLVKCPFHLESGYISGLWGVSAMPVLLRRSDDDTTWETWMSLSPHEIESQELGCRYARGNVVVMGLGMGWVAINMAMSATVKKVTIIEKDEEVIALFRESGALNGLDASVRMKLHIVHADALEWTTNDHVDFLYVDIWKTLDEAPALGQVQFIYENIPADSVYFWGQEIKISNILGRDQFKELRLLSPDEFRKIVHDRVQLPLLVPTVGRYAEAVEAVMRCREGRGIKPSWKLSAFN